MGRRWIVLIASVAVLVLLGCGPSSLIGGQATATPTLAPSPTSTLVPTNTPAPTATPTKMPLPTNTKAPTATPKPVVKASPTAVSAGGQGGMVAKPTGKPAGTTEPGGAVFEFLSHTGWVADNGDVSVVGEVKNVSNASVGNMVVVQAQLKDKSGNVIPGDYYAYLDRPVIAPGQTSSFWVFVRKADLQADPADVTDYELTTLLTDTPSPDTELKVTDASSSIEADGYTVSGSVLNQTSKTYKSLAVYSTIYDSSGQVMNVTLDTVDLDVPLAPGQTAQFSGYFPDHYDGASSFAVIVTGWEDTGAGTGAASSPTPSSAGTGSETDFVFVDHTGFITQDGGVSIVGEVQWEGSAPLTKMVKVSATITDKDGNELPGDFHAWLDRPAIAPGERSSFWIAVSPSELGGVDPSTLTDYVLDLAISDTDSPDREILVTSAKTAVDSAGLHITGTARNNTDLTFVALTVYTTVYDADGHVINVTSDLLKLDSPLLPNQDIQYSGFVPEHFDGYDSVTVYVTGWTKEAWDAAQSG